MDRPFPSTRAPSDRPQNAGFHGNGAGGFGAANVVSWSATNRTDGSNRPWHVVAADLDGDGRVDLAVAAGNSVATVLLNVCTP